MRSQALVLASLALIGCGAGAGAKKGTYFVPRSALASLGDGVQVVGTHDSGLLVEAQAADEAELRAKAPKMFRMDHWARERSSYDYSSMEKKIQQLARDYPNLVKVDVYGTSVEGRSEYALTLKPQGRLAAMPEVMITGATHGNEIATVDVALGLAERILKGYGTDPRFTKMLNEHTVYIIPAVCVDSYVAQTRANEDTDPNRSYPYPDDTVGHTTHAVQDMITWFKAHDIAGAIDYHSAASMIMYPWAYTYDHIPEADHQHFETVTAQMAKTNGYAHGDIASTIYVAPGSSADYWYWTHKTFALGIELEHDYEGNNDPSDQIKQNAESTWIFIESIK